jgi:hypothetical protein
VTVFLGPVERRFSDPTEFLTVVASSLGHDWPQATSEGGAKRPVCWDVQQSGGESPLCNLMEVKHE